MKKYKIILYLSLMPFLITIIYGIYNSIFGIKVFCQSYAGDICPTYYGVRGFFISVFIYSVEYWYTYIIGVLLFIIFLIINKKKKHLL